MQQPERLVGYVPYKGQEVPFEFDFDEFTLFLYPAKEITQKSFFAMGDKPYDPSKHEWIPHKKITGTCADNRKVIFSIGNLLASFNSFPAYNVDWYCYGTPGFNHDQITALYFEGDIVDSFYNPKKALDFNVQVNPGAEDFSRISVSITPPKTILCGACKITDSINAKIEITTYGIPNALNYSQPIYAKSQLSFTFDSPLDLDTALSVITNLQKFFVFITYRFDVRNQNATLISYNKEGKQVHSSLLAFPKKEIAPIDGNHSKRIIDYDILKEQTGKLIEELNANKILLDQTPTIDTRNSITPGRTAMIFAAFERVVNSYYGIDAGRSDEYKNIKQEFGKHLDDFINSKTGKAKKHATQIKNLFNYFDSSLEQKVKHALNDCFATMSPLLNNKYNDCNTKTIEALCKRLNKLRNFLVHGNLGLEINPIHVADIQFLEVLIYAIVLKHVGISPEASRTALGQLFNESSLL